jgi:methylated-DNA-[protein]-cysteine S-methyltransferase
MLDIPSIIYKATPIGKLILIADEQSRLCASDWADHQVILIKLLNINCRQTIFSLVKTTQSY